MPHVPQNTLFVVHTRKKGKVDTTNQNVMKVQEEVPNKKKVVVLPIEHIRQPGIGI
jgi:ribosomal protein L21E